jgi:hypothetical protein
MYCFTDAAKGNTKKKLKGNTRQVVDCDAGCGGTGGCEVKTALHHIDEMRPGPGRPDRAAGLRGRRRVGKRDAAEVREWDEEGAFLEVLDNSLL